MGATEQRILQTHFGAFLKMRRDQWDVTQREVLHYFPGWTQANYSRLESGAIAPAFNQLLPLYTACLRAGIHWNASDRHQFITLAQARIASKQTHPDHHSEHEWAELRYQMTNVDFFPEEPIEPITHWMPPKPLLAETRHLIGRDDWHASLIHAIQTSTPRKLIILQGPVGIGKSSELHRLIQHFIHASNPAYHVIWIPLLPAERSAGPESSLDLVLGNILAESGAPPVSAEMASWEKRQRLVLAHLEQSTRPVVILIDNAESILTEEGLLSTCWEEFLTHFLRHQHQATLVLATKEWPGWPGRDRLFVHETTVPPLDLSTSVSLLQQLGLASVPLQHLQEAYTRVGGIPLCLEWVAALVHDPLSLDDWQSFSGSSTPEQRPEVELTTRLIHLIAEPTLLRGHFATKLQPLLTRILEKRLSPEAQKLLHHLAVCNIPLGKTALQTLCEHPKAIRELRNASLLVAYSHRVQVLPMVADAVVQGLAAGEVRELEEVVIRALQAWVDEGTIDYREAGHVITGLAILLLNHHRLLEAAELLILYGWLSINQEYIHQIIQIFTNISQQPGWRYSEKNECGELLLRVFFSRYLKCQTSDTEIAFCRIDELVRNRSVELSPGTSFYLLHNKISSLVKQDQYSEALTRIKNEYSQYQALRDTDPVLFIEFLNLRAYVSGRWSDVQSVNGNKEEALRLRQTCIDVHLQCIALLDQYASSATPLQKIYILFIRARYLNDIAYYQRSMGYIEEARQAMEECLKLKEQGFTLPGSLATSYGNYGQLLGDLGHFQEALAYSDRALQIIQKMIDTGLSPFQKEKGLQLIERGELLLLLGCLDEAKVCFEKGIPLVEGTSRQVSATVARKGVQFMEQRYKENSHYYLDHQWFPRYHELASYSDVSWLTQAGPFLEEEQQEWDVLIQQKEHTSASKRLSSIIVTSRKRELEASLREQREPRFHYPRVPFDEVQTRIAGFSRLRAEIERDERNAIVRRLYFGAIDELLDELHMIVSASRRNDEAFWTFNQRLNPTPTIIEMETAVGQLTSLLRNGVLRDDTRGLAKQLIQHIRQWHIDPMSSHYGSEDAEQDALAEQKKQLVTLHGSPKLFSPETVSQFFVDIFRQYQFPWTVTHDLATDHAYISQPLKQLVLPADKWISGEKIRNLLGHEIETHVFRAVAGEKSSLALLSIGLGGYLETEEGLAIYYTQEASGYNATEKPDKPWLGTLATGLAVGVICEPYTFRKLQMFLESVNTLRSLLAEENLSVAEIQENARRNAQNRCLRTWRGVTDLTRPGICSTKDNVYLRGYLAVSQALAKDTMAFERLMVGAIGLQHLDDLTELGITAPPVKHLRLATDPELDTYIARFAD